MAGTARSGLLWALGGFMTLSFGDAVVKSMNGLWAPVAIAATRYVLGAAGLSALLLWREGAGAFRMKRPELQLLRGAGVAMATAGFFSALRVMPLATATAITFTQPVLTALLAAAFLGERVPRATFGAIALALTGVMLALRPDFAAIGLKACFPLLSALGMAILMVGNRATAGSASPLALQAFVSLFAAPILLALTLAAPSIGLVDATIGWPMPSVLARCALIACSATTAHWLIFKGTTLAGAAEVAPMTYAQLIVAGTIGWVAFGERPDPLAATGAALIILSGLWLWHAKRPREVAETP